MSLFFNGSQIRYILSFLNVCFMYQFSNNVNLFRGTNNLFVSQRSRLQFKGCSECWKPQGTKSRGILIWLNFNFIINTFNRTGYFLVHIAAQSNFLEQASHRVEHWLHLPQLDKNEKCHFCNIKKQFLQRKTLNNPIYMHLRYSYNFLPVKN